MSENRIQAYVEKNAFYLEEIRERVFLLAKVFCLTYIAGFFLTTPLLKWFLAYSNMKHVTIVTTSPFQLIDLAMSMGFFFASALSVPVLIYQIYSFTHSGLLPKERRAFFFSLAVGVVLFFVGFIYGALTIYFATQFVAQVNVTLGIVNYWDITSFISQIIFTSSLLGLLFLFPIVITFLIKLGLITVDFLKSKRRHAFIGILIFVSLLPPTDGLSLILMALPLVVIFEITILVNNTKKRLHFIK